MNRSGAARRRAILGLFFLPAAFCGGAARADFVLSEPSSIVYYRYLAAAGAEINAEKESSLTGDLHSNGDVRFKKDSSVVGDVSAVGRVRGAGAVQGSVEEGATPVPLPAPLSEAEARALADRVFEGDSTFTGDQVVDDVVFVSGNATFRGHLSGEGTVIAAGDIRLESPRPGAPAPPASAMRISFIAHHDIRVLKGRALRGVLHAGGDIDLDKEVELSGVLVAGGRLDVRKSPLLAFEDFDTGPPTISDLAPPDGSFVALATPTVSATFADDLSGVDPATFAFSLDGVDRSAEAVADADGFSFTPGAPLAEGPHEAEVSVSDFSGKRATAAWSFVVDTVPPAIAITAPTAPLLYNEVGPIEVAYEDATSGVDLATLQVAVDAADVTPSCTVGTASATCSAPTLDEGPHAILATVSDRAGNTAAATFEFELLFDLDPPTLGLSLPEQTLVIEESTLRFGANYGDAESGADLATLLISVDGVDVTPGCSIGPNTATCRTPTLVTGPHQASAELADRAGNVAQTTVDFEVIVDLEPPVVTIASPADGSLLAQPTVTVSGTATDDAGLLTLTVNGMPVSPATGQYSVDLGLSEGANIVRVRAVDLAARQSSAEVLVTLDTVPPLLELEAPEPGRTTNAPTVRVSGRATDLNGIAGVTINGVPVPLDDGRFEETVALAEGPNPVAARAVDEAGNVAETGREVTRFTVPTIAIDSPENLTVVATAAVDVTGTVSDPSASVLVNFVPAAVSGDSFFASGVPVFPGSTLINAVATLPDGRRAADSIMVFRDTEPPSVRIYYPADGATLFGATTTVTGLVNDLVPGTVNSPQATVTVNGVPAEVNHRSFRALGVALAPGDNTIVAEAVDSSGNAAQAAVTVRREDPTGARVSIVAGNDQTGVVSEELAQPLEVVLLDAAGNPVPGRNVVFSTRTDGVLGGTARRIAVASGADGRAATTFRMGTRAGVQQVEASAVGFAGPAAFTLAALPGAPARLLLDSGDQQAGTAGGPVPRPLVTVVTDAGFNRLEGVPVTFRVRRGDGLFKNGLQEITVPSDSDGRAAVTYTLDPEEGFSNNAVVARLDGVAGAPAVGFTATGLAAGDPAMTSVSGIVLDNVNQPVPGATVVILDTSLTSVADSEGRFSIAGAPVGSVHLVVDGATTARPGTWPQLEFTLFNVPGRDNNLGMPIYLLPIDVANGLAVGPATGGTLTVPQVPGFSLEIASGSVTFPDGSTSGVVSVTEVHNDKVPMVPNFGQQPRFIVTIQPAGAHFDPPARVTYPNLDGLPPGRTTTLYSFDHDLEQFVSIGPGTVSDDGLVIVSDPGVGIVKGGWHSASDPDDDPPTCPHGCPDCQRCDDGTCVDDDSQTPPQNATDDCMKEICRGGKVRSIKDESETPPQNKGNCQRETCGPRPEPDLGDALAGFGCCGDPARPTIGPFLYNLETECCERDLLFGFPTTLPKVPVSNTKNCPRRVQRPDFVPMSNGCTGVPDNPAGGTTTAFSNGVDRPCDLHDECYQTCKQGEDEANRSGCDGAFCSGMEAVCNAAASTEDVPTLAKCFFFADVYCEGVQTLGGVFYLQGQQEACQCCP